MIKIQTPKKRVTYHQQKNTPQTKILNGKNKVPKKLFKVAENDFLIVFYNKFWLVLTILTEPTDIQDHDHTTG